MNEIDPVGWSSILVRGFTDSIVSFATNHQINISENENENNANTKTEQKPKQQETEKNSSEKKRKKMANRKKNCLRAFGSSSVEFKDFGVEDNDYLFLAFNPSKDEDKISSKYWMVECLGVEDGSK